MKPAGTNRDISPCIILQSLTIGMCAVPLGVSHLAAVQKLYSDDAAIVKQIQSLGDQSLLLLPLVNVQDAGRQLAHGLA